MEKKNLDFNHETNYLEVKNHSILYTSFHLPLLTIVLQI